MPHNRYFLESIFTTQAEVLLIGEEAHHLTRVMRKNKGDEVELINGKHQLAFATIERIEKKEVRLHISEVTEQSPPKRALIICQALARFNRLETITEKGTELGMTALWLFPGHLSEKKDLSANQINRLRAIAIAALKQSGRLDLPPIVLYPPLEKWKSIEFPAYFGDLGPDAPPLLMALSECPSDDFIFFVGPETGFSSSEKDRLCELQAQGVRLHPNILRTDTASLTALSVISNYFLTHQTITPSKN